VRVCELFEVLLWNCFWLKLLNSRCSCFDPESYFGGSPGAELKSNEQFSLEKMRLDVGN